MLIVDICRWSLHIFTIIYHYLPHSFQSLPAPAPSCPQWTPGLSPGPWLIVETPPEFASSWWQGSSSVAANLKWDAYDAWNITAWVLSCLGTPKQALRRCSSPACRSLQPVYRNLRKVDGNMYLEIWRFHSKSQSWIQTIKLTIDGSPQDRNDPGKSSALFVSVCRQQPRPSKRGLSNVEHDQAICGLGLKV